jgi:membrane protease YdiL (CAAX protease family)
MKKAIALCLLEITVIGLAIWQPTIGWLSPEIFASILFPIFFLIVLPISAIWLWRNEGRTLQDIGLRRDIHVKKLLIWGLLLGLIIPIIVMLVQVLCGWVVLSPNAISYGDLPVFVIVPGYIALTLLKMIMNVSIEEFVFRGYFLHRFAIGIGVVWAWLFSSILWGIGHLVSMLSEGLSPFSIAMAMLTFTIWGIALSIGCWRNGKSLWFPFGVHYGVNISFSLLGAFLQASYKAPQWLVGNPNWVPESGILGTMVWLVVILVVLKITPIAKLNKKPEARLVV